MSWVAVLLLVAQSGTFSGGGAQGDGTEGWAQTIFLDQITRQLDIQAEGEFSLIDTAQVLTAASPIIYKNGGTSIYVVVIAGSDVSGTITVSGTVIDQDTGAEAYGTEALTITAASNDLTSTDADALRPLPVTFSRMRRWSPRASPSSAMVEATPSRSIWEPSVWRHTAMV